MSRETTRTTLGLQTQEGVSGFAKAFAAGNSSTPSRKRGCNARDGGKS